MKRLKNPRSHLDNFYNPTARLWVPTHQESFQLQRFPLRTEDQNTVGPPRGLAVIAKLFYPN